MSFHLGGGGEYVALLKTFSYAYVAMNLESISPWRLSICISIALPIATWTIICQAWFSVTPRWNRSFLRLCLYFWHHMYQLMAYHMIFYGVFLVMEYELPLS